MPPDSSQRSAKTEILVIEDDWGVSYMLNVALSHCGMVVTLAATGEQGVQVYRERHKSIDIVLLSLDVQMNGMDGPATLAALRAIDCDVPCCFMSGNTGQYSKEDLLGMGAKEVLVKPFGNLRALAKRLEEIARNR